MSNVIERWECPECGQEVDDEERAGSAHWGNAPPDGWCSGVPVLRSYVAVDALPKREDDDDRLEHEWIHGWNACVAAIEAARQT